MIKSAIYRKLYRLGQILTLPLVGEISKQLDALANRVDQVDSRLNSFVGHGYAPLVNKRLDALENRVDPVDSRLNSFVGRLDALTNQVDHVDSKLTSIVLGPRVSHHTPVFTEGGDPTLVPPAGYSEERSYAIISEAFRRCFEFLWGSRVSGSILEFGTFRGYSARIIAELMREFGASGHLYLYDSFVGLPVLSSDVDALSYEVAVNKVWGTGQMEVDEGLPEHVSKTLGEIIAPNRLHVVKGFYGDSLSENLPTEKAALVHLDCDLYQSAKEVLHILLQNDLLQDGTVIVLDDYNCNRANPLMGERRAMADGFSQQSRFTFSPWFAYGWHGQTVFVHDTSAREIIVASAEQTE